MKRYIKGAFSPSTPNWLKDVLNKNYFYWTKDELIHNLHLKLNTANFLDTPTENSIPVYLIETDNGLDIYVPGYNDDHYINIGGRFRMLGNIRKKILNERTLAVVYLDMDDPDNFDNSNHYRNPRYDYDIDVKHGKYAGQQKDKVFKDRGWRTFEYPVKRDKSGYVIPDRSNMIE